jgi:hypothetical protein
MFAGSSLHRFLGTNIALRTAAHHLLVSPTQKMPAFFFHTPRLTAPKAAVSFLKASFTQFSIALQHIAAFFSAIRALAQGTVRKFSYPITHMLPAQIVGITNPICLNVASGIWAWQIAYWRNIALWPSFRVCAPGIKTGLTCIGRLWGYFFFFIGLLSGHCWLVSMDLDNKPRVFDRLRLLLLGQKPLVFCLVFAGKGGDDRHAGLTGLAEELDRKGWALRAVGETEDMEPRMVHVLELGGIAAAFD